MLSPIGFSARTNNKLTFKNSRYVDKEEIKLSYEIEAGVLQVFEADIASVKAVEELK